MSNIAERYDYEGKMFVDKCMQYVKLKGIQALRLSYLNGGNRTHEIPPIEIYLENYYKEYQFPTISFKTM